MMEEQEELSLFDNRNEAVTTVFFICCNRVEVRKRLGKIPSRHK